jgi:hypothetical protein
VIRTLVSPATDRYLGIYLNDHRALSSAGLALARRCHRENKGTPFGAVLELLMPELDEDAATLERVAQVLRVSADPFKITAAMTGEMLGRFKLNGQLFGYSPLSRVLEIEVLIAGIEAKRLLWNAVTAAHRPELASFDFLALAQRAAAQRDHLEPQHRLAAQLAFSAADHVGEVVTPDSD